MNNRYEKCKQQWNEIFQKCKISVPSNPNTGNKLIDEGLDWLCENRSIVLDFGCGSGSYLFYCALRGTKKHIGIDLSEEAINLANKRKDLMDKGEFEFFVGDVKQLEKIENETIESIIISNTIDNLYPEDAIYLMEQVKRILKKNGKVFLKLNPFITNEQIKEYNIKVIDGNLLDDGFILWNNTTEEWSNFFKEYLLIFDFYEVYYPEYNQINRLFLLVK